MMKGRWFRLGDLIPIGLVLAAAAMLCIWSARAAVGQKLCVTTPTEELVFSLAADRETVIVGDNGLSLTVVIEDGGACVRAADCPDQVCVHTGRLTKDGDTAACLPAGVMLTVTGGGDADTPDAVAR